MKAYKETKIWMVSGSQHLYGEQTLLEVDSHTREIAGYLSGSDKISADIEYRGIVTTPAEVKSFFVSACADENCAGVILWMHTFSPSKMWINGLSVMTKPILHLHTQYNRDIPWELIDMDFMNLNQSAHGGREHGFINSRMGVERKVVAGYWKDPAVQKRIDCWIRAASAAADLNRSRLARFGDNMRDVAVTEGDKVSAQIRFGYDVYGYGLAELAECVADVAETRVSELIEEYECKYSVDPVLLRGGDRHQSLRDAASLEAGIEDFLVGGDFSAFTTTFEDLAGLSQLPGLACQRLMQKGYGFGAEGDWKTAALVRGMKVMGRGLGGGTSFMEDYTYHLDPGGQFVLGSHMLEVCPSIAGSNSVKMEIHPLGIGGKDDPVRLIFDVSPGPALNASLMDMGSRFRLLVNEIETVEPPEALPRLPVARALWRPFPELSTSAEAWILAGGAHHTAFSRDVTTEILADWARICRVELLVIDRNTKLQEFEKEMRWNDLYYSMRAVAGGV